ncbi:MAG: LuxR C-terminal-related transcriptional regulator [Lysobacteraceae bacterium]
MNQSFADWRHAQREDSSDAWRLRRLQQLLQALAEQPDDSDWPRQLLVRMCEPLGVHDAALLQRTNDGVRVMAALGQARPRGARVAGAGDWPVMSSRATLRDHLRRDDGVAWCLPQAAKLTDELHLGVWLAGRALGAVVMRVPTAEALDRATRDWLLAMAELAAVPLLQAQAPGTERGTRRPRNHARLTMLTRRERQVLALLPRGLSNAALGEALGVSTATAKTHVERILRKLECGDRVQAAVLATRAGLST